MADLNDETETLMISSGGTEGSGIIDDRPIEERITILESQVAGLFEQNKNMLEHFREMIEIISEDIE